MTDYGFERACRLLARAIVFAMGLKLGGIDYATRVYKEFRKECE